MHVYTCSGPSALTVNVTRNSELLSVDVLWAAVDDFLNVTCTVNWTSDGIDVQTATLINQTSYTITGLTLDTVYTITVRAANMCGQGPEYSTTVSFPTGMHLRRISMYTHYQLILL